MDIAQLTLSKLNKNLKEKGIQLLITEELKEKIVELGYNPIFGAREMRRVVQDKIENKLAEALLLGSIKRGNNISINPTTFEIDINSN
jgi:ATP-dependent Clp protease ATP-binding subunit ClpA